MKYLNMIIGALFHSLVFTAGMILLGVILGVAFNLVPVATTISIVVLFVMEFVTLYFKYKGEKNGAQSK